MKENNPIDNYFRNSLREHEVKASPEAWQKVVAGTESKGNKAMIWYLMRAAVVVLMLSIGTWYTVDYINTADTRPGVATTPDLQTEESKQNEGQEQPLSTSQDGEEKDSQPAGEEERDRQRVIPIMKQKQSRTPIYVDAEPTREVDEEALYDHSEIELASVELDPAQLAAYSSVSPSMKLRLNRAIPTGENEFSSDELAAGQEDLKTRLYAYANTQFDNIKNGRPLELPRTGKPRLQINLDKLLNN